MSISTNRFRGSFQGSDRSDEDSIRPSQRIMLAVLNEAIAMYEDGLRAESIDEFAQMDRVEDWFAGQTTDWPVDYSDVCDSLGLEPAFVRDALFLSKLGVLQDSGCRQARFESAMLPAAGTEMHVS